MSYSTQLSTRVYTSIAQNTPTKPLPSPKTQKELEFRVHQAKMIREEAKAEADSIRTQGKDEADTIRKQGKNEANALRQEAAKHGQTALEAKQGMEASDDRISKLEALKAKALEAKQKRKEQEAVPSRKDS